MIILKKYKKPITDKPFIALVNDGAGTQLMILQHSSGEHYKSKSNQLIHEVNISHYSDMNKLFVSSIEYKTIETIGERATTGLQTYNTDLDRTDKDNIFWITQTIEELLDASLYLRKLLNQLTKV